MNPPPPPPPATPSSSSFPLIPPPPGPNQNPNPFFSHPPPFPYQPSIANSLTSTSTFPNLPTALSTLTSLLQRSRSILDSLPTPFHASTPTLIPCPRNPNHRLPPSSLFSHFLHCPSSSSPILPSSFLSSLHYPHTLNHPDLAPIPIPDNANSISLPLDKQCPSPSNFFYSDCPAVVAHFHNHNPPQPLTLPTDLFVKCADFDESNCNDNGGVSKIGCHIRLSSIRLLPSEIWAIKNEVEEWRDYPGSYSCRVVRAILCLDKSDLVDLPTWVVVNSVKYGVVIDSAMRDHILLLLKFCLKAIIDEAIGFGEGLFSDEVKGKCKSDNYRSFSCPVLGRVLVWLASQLAVLYGEVSGKFFSISMLKQCVSDASLSCLMFSDVKDSEKVDEGTAEEELEDNGENNRERRAGGRISKSKIYLSQVVVAVAALHERSMLEKKIRALRDSPHLTPYQRIMEHETISRIADEERKRLPNYRPLTEHDGLHRQQSSNEESNKHKTREELLAEERDYKRRRMSYRGKKSKRSTTEVMRDIIEEYMEEIKQGSGFGFSEPTKELGDSSTISRELEYSNREPSNSHYNMQPTESSNGYPEGNKILRSDTRSYLGHSGSDRSIRRPQLEEDYPRSHDGQRNRDSDGANSRNSDRQRNRRKRGDNSRSPDRQQSRRDEEDYSGSPREKRSSRLAFRRSIHQTKHGELSRELYPRSSDGKYSLSNKRSSHHSEAGSHYVELKRNKQQRKSHQRDSSASEFQDRYSIPHEEFEDRYNPLEYHDTCEGKR